MYLIKRLKKKCGDDQVELLRHRCFFLIIYDTFRSVYGKILAY